MKIKPNAAHALAPLHGIAVPSEAVGSAGGGHAAAQPKREATGPEEPDLGVVGQRLGARRAAPLRPLPNLPNLPNLLDTYTKTETPLVALYTRDAVKVG